MLIEQEYILLIMSCKKYERKADYQRTTWIPNLPSSIIKHYHVIGDKNLWKDFEFDNERQILYVNTPDDYNSLPKKVIAALSAIKKTFEFKYVFKTDDDQVLLYDNFFHMI